MSYNIQSLNVDHMVDILSKSYINMINACVPFSQFPTVMLWGAPGVGKSQGVRQIANKIEEYTSKEVSVTDVRLLLFNPVDLRGIPTANDDKTLAVWLKPQIFQMDESEEVVNILFLDEITAAPPSVQAAAYQITLDRTIGEHRLPNNCIVIAAGNRVTDKSVSYNMPKALANRLLHMGIREDTYSWHSWAIRSGIHPYVIGFIEYSSTALIHTDGNELAFPTPRSWEMVSNILNYISDKTGAVYPMIVGCVGEVTANIFRSWTEIYEGLPSIEAIFKNGIAETPKEREAQIALRSVMVNSVRDCPDKSRIDCSIDYSCKMPLAFRRKLLKDYYKIPDVRPILEENDVFRTALEDGLEC